MKRYICIHGHFYQPPRENPWLETIELQESAYPYHDWNERIKAECYAPNAASRIFDGEGCIERIVNNYARISFNFGPTLLAWMKDKAPATYTAIQEADRDSQEQFGGHGNAIAQCYNHMIMPLANSRDKRTQVVWGLRDFEHRFGRAPEGMWLPETAVDLETLDLMAEQGVKYTILSPYQAGSFRKLEPEGQAPVEQQPPAQEQDAGDQAAGEEKKPEPNAWHDAVGARIDPTRPYLQRLPSGRSITIFFYDGPISQSIAFGNTLDKGENLANRLTGAFNDGRDWPQLVHIATDGETYGHHHHFGDMALAYAIDYIESHGDAEIINYGAYLQKYPPEWEVRVLEDTAWSCSHGVGRWKENCGCNSGGHPGWNQEWRAPLRAALDWLRDQLAPRYEQEAKKYFKDPWAAREDYIDVILDRGGESRDAFLARHATHKLNEQEIVTVRKLLELQRHAMLMYTSCGWFFDELSGIETVQVIQYAARALQLANDLFSGSLEPEFLDRLAQAKSNIPENGDGRTVFDKFVRPAEIDLKRVAAHYAVSSLFESYPDESRIYAFSVDCRDAQRMEAGIARLLVSHAQFTSEITRESAHLSFGALHLGDQNLSGGVREFKNDEYRAVVKEVREAFDRGDMAEVMRCLDAHFPLSFSLESLFKDEQQKAISIILEPTLSEARANYRAIYDRRASFLRFLGAIHHPLPPELITAAGFAVNSELFRAIHSDPTDLEHFKQLFEESRRLNLILDASGLAFDMSKVIDAHAEELRERPEDIGLIEREARTVEVGATMPLPVNLWHAQNLYYDMLGNIYPDYRAKADGGDEEAGAWVTKFLELGDRLKVKVPEFQPAAAAAKAIKVVP